MAYEVSSIVYPAYTPVAPPVYSVSTPLVSSIPTPSQSSESSKMPSTTTTYVTSALTMTSYVTAHYSASPVPKKCDKDIIGTVQKLPQSVQTYVFEAISSSKCSPCDYACICGDLHGKDVAGKVSKGCSQPDYETYMAFEKEVCEAHPSYPTSIIVTPTPYPEKNKTQEMTTYTTTTVCPITTDGKVTTTTSTITVTSCKAYCTAPPPPPQPPVYPTGNNVTSPNVPEYTGAAVANAPAVLLAGAVGIFGWAFAAL
ncbi:uncharacterized protein M421DRAFT_89335 [Didymella exigua CBS 183.55]|uniref:Extracellular membrane protein CFEM domain-containing protein n=1 Tax=Didymella exigua CBS 183.55 TaxID=1150837 RepID=A0A6A5S0D7_9PLEO|nr:uncharacterized protein M421DRAFT_89335 [Didymella exigua CBS 183.55]KAF1933050.1 hypothetical protein M421DRAFT_89335 [Didymella exigua CBS 183.55]